MTVERPTLSLDTVLNISTTPSTITTASFNDDHCMGVSLFLQLYFDDFTEYKSVQIIFGIFYAFIFFAGLVSNSLILFAVVKKPELRIVRNVFIVGLAISNLFICFTSLPMTAITNLNKQWLFGVFLCKVTPIFQALGITVSTFSLTCIAFDRYILIVHPAWKSIEAKHAIFLMIAIWSLGIVIALPSFLAQALIRITEPYKLCEQFCYEQWENMILPKEAYSVSCMFAQFIIPLLLMSYWYFRIAWQLKAHATFRNRSSSTLVERENRTSHSLIKTVIIMYATFVFCWSFYSVFTLLTDFKALPPFFKNQNFFCHLVAHSIAMTSVIWNPLLYGFANHNFKRAFVEIIPCLQAFGLSRIPCSGSNSAASATFTRLTNRVTEIGGLRNNDFRRYGSAVEFPLAPPKSPYRTSSSNNEPFLQPSTSMNNNFNPSPSPLSLRYNILENSSVEVQGSESLDHTSIVLQNKNDI